MAMFSLSSHAVHGNWQDLLQYHLNEKDGGFVPDGNWNDAKPQMVNSTTILSAQACIEYCQTLPECSEKRLIQDQLLLVYENARNLEIAHERFLFGNE